MSKLILVTGASGFVASHIVHQLLEQGYRVRGVARGQRLEDLRKYYKAKPEVGFVEINDIVHGDFHEALQGVGAIIHTASPLPGKADFESMLTGAVEGSLNVLRQGEAAGIKKFVVTSSMVALWEDPRIQGEVYKADHWNPVTREAAQSSKDPMLIYSATKKFAELAVWEWAESHPHVDVTTINPPFIYGPLLPSFTSLLRGGISMSNISTDHYVYSFLDPDGKFPSDPGYSDVRDVARAHVGALSTPSSIRGKKRVIMASPYGFDLKEVVEMVEQKRPELANRIIKKPPPEKPYDPPHVDYARIEEVTGIKKQELYSLEQTVLDTVDSFVRAEAAHKKAEN